MSQMLFYGVAVVLVLTLRSAAHARAKRAHSEAAGMEIRIGRPDYS